MTTLELLKKYLCNYFVNYNQEGLHELVTDDIHCYGLAQDEDIHSYEDYKRVFISKNSERFQGCQLKILEENQISEESATLVFSLGRKNIDVQYRVVGNSRQGYDGRKLCLLSFIEIKSIEEDRNKDILGEAMPGGIMGGYIEPGFPFYCVNDNMLNYLGYSCQEEFVQDIDGFVENCIHPDDRPSVNLEVEKQIRKTGGYEIEYRMRNKEHGYIWVHDLGKKIKAEDGRDAIISACYDITKEKEHSDLLDSLVNNSAGGMALYRVEKDWRMTPLFASEGVGNLAGFNEEEYLELCDDDAMKSIFIDDRSAVMSSIYEAISHGKVTSQTYRVPNNQGGYRWINGFFSKFGEDSGRPVMRAVFTPTSLQHDLQMQALSQNETGVCIIDVNTNELYYANEASFYLHGTKPCDYIGKTCSEAFFCESARCDSCWRHELANGQGHTVTSFRDKILSVTSEAREWNGNKVIVVYQRDITSQLKLQESVENSNKEFLQLLHNIACGLCVCSIDRDKNSSVKYISDGFCKMFEGSKDELLQRYRKDPSRGVHHEDLPAVKAFVKKCTLGPCSDEITYRYTTIKGSLIWVTLKAVVISDGRDGLLSYGTYFDVTERIKIQKQLTDVVHNAPGGVCMYRWNGREMEPLIVSKQIEHLFGTDDNKTKESLRAMDFSAVHPDDVDVLRETVMSNLKSPGEMYSHTYRVWNEKKKMYSWICTAGICIPQEDGTKIIYANYSDVNEAKKLEQRLSQDEKILRARIELEKKKVLGSDASMLGYVITNVSNNSVVECDILRTDVLAARQGMSLEKGMDIAAGIFPKEDFERYCKLHDKSELLRKYRNGITTFEFEGRHISETGTLRWVRSAFNLLRDPVNDDILLYEYLYDIHGQKILEEIMAATAKYDYERVASVNIKDGQMTVINQNNPNIFRDLDVWNYDEHSREYGMTKVLTEDREHFLNGINLERVSAELEDTDCYEFVHRIVEDDGSTGYRRTRFSYYNRELGICLMTRANVTKVVLEEERKAHQLMEALSQTRQALAAKEEATRDRERISTALFSIVPMVISANITKGYYSMINYDDYTTKVAAREGTYEELIEVGRSTVPDSQKDIFAETFSKENVISSYQSGKKSIVLEHQQLGDDGIMRWMETRCIFVNNESTGELYTITLAQDITERKQSQENLQKALNAAEAAAHTKSEFLSRMSHEIRTPMNAIMGMTAIAKENRADYMQVGECLDKIHMSSQFLLTLIDDILEANRIESGRTEIKHSEFSFDSLIESVRTVVEPLALKSNIRYEFINNASTDSHYLGDTTRIQQVLVNLIGNAIKFTKTNGKVRFSVNIDRETDERTDFRFTVADTGIGMSEEFMKKMFQPFTQEDGSNTSEYGGSGLGLAISKSLIEAMNGKISAESMLGVGSTFVVELPLDRESSPAEDVPVVEKKKEVDLDILKGKQVLMAEDHPLNVVVARRLLERKGINVSVAENGRIAVDMFCSSAHNYYDAILMDIRMPVMDGLDAAKTIRSLDRPDAAAVPIIAITANALEEDRERSRQAGMNMHLAKPFDPKQLYIILAEQIEAFEKKEDSSDEQ